MKAQAIRILDVTVIGPVMVLGGILLLGQRHIALGGALVLFGAMTIVYNGCNYLRRREELTP